jgi:hypothetical protein
MFDPSSVGRLLDWTSDDLRLLPNAEDERYEFKSSATTDGDLGNKIARAASGFWNTGGGLFVAGVDGRGQPDGGLSLTVGRQSRRDWVDQHIARVTPRGGYVVHVIEGPLGEGGVRSGHGVVLLGFETSEIGPHMAPDDRYYIRTGAHTVSASHFIVESIRARRGVTRPLLRAILRRKPGNYGVIQLGIIALSDAPALDVTLAIDPLPTFLESARGDRFPLHIPAINAQVPFFLDFHALTFGGELPVCEVRLLYRDLLGREYGEANVVDVERQMGPGSLGATDAQLIERRLQELEKSIKSVASAITKNEGHLRAIVSKLR